MADSECANLKCLNGGTCYTQISGDAIVREYCICPPDKTGETCAEVKDCELNCIHGDCLYPFTPVNGQVANDFSREPYCKCDEGFTGILCESEVDDCADGIRSCYNGGKCKEEKNSGESTYTCDCSVIPRTSPFVGLECEHPAETICSLMTVTKDSFCVNGGTCKDIVYTEE